LSKIFRGFNKNLFLISSLRFPSFMRESSYCFQRVLAITVLSIRPSVCHTGGSCKNSPS